MTERGAVSRGPSSGDREPPRVVGPGLDRLCEPHRVYLLLAREAYRMARAFLEAGDRKRAFAALQPLAVAGEIMDLARRAFEPFGDPMRLETAALARAGWAVLLMELRGSGWSAGPACPFPEAWSGREDAMQTTCAHDVLEGLRALSVAAGADTSRYLLVGVGPTAPIAVEAAALDRRVLALLLLSPAPAPVDRGRMRERIRSLHRPIYFSSAPEDFMEFEFTDALYQAGDRPRSRVADVSAPGSGARPFRGDRAAVGRLIAWLQETFPARAASGPRPGPPRSR